MIQLHASTVALNGRGLIILGPSGSGKSSLALDLMAAGAVLVADDRTDLRVEEGRLVASAPAGVAGRIEARGIGILAAETAPAALMMACDLGLAEDMRLPKWRHVEWLGMRLPLVLGPYRPHLHAALRQMLLAGRLE
ncbi:HPr kinase/phosphatase C-terminal domain-containing protein [Paracoccus bogoriensis]|uniref:HPr kinase/phosphorylase n=1 Tax=Paracoccus bogoriensis TaxID=242065 RepID=UPI001CA4E8F0|nr:HPr kinase/phosphatase C-terminal domain-containing protein [Paracoccus bogoriensis]MBW7056853.1 HPr kinase/phosphatase C-terminal domain-containing protein [Paracoccus bogoriensis]